MCQSEKPLGAHGNTCLYPVKPEQMLLVLLKCDLAVVSWETL